MTEEYDELREDIMDFIANRPAWFDVKRGEDFGDDVLRRYDKVKALADLVPEFIELADPHLHCYEDYDHKILAKCMRALQTCVNNLSTKARALQEGK